MNEITQTATTQSVAEKLKDINLKETDLVFLLGYIKGMQANNILTESKSETA
jgi:hypothetical protein